MLLKEKLKKYDIILASHSPRRRQLMTDCGLNFRIADKYDVEEIYPDNIPSSEVPVYLSVLKSKYYPEPLTPKQILVTADTVVILDDHILGKPKDRNDAIAILSSLSGRKHTVITGVTLRNSAKTYSFSSSTDVFFKRLSMEEIEYYIDTYRPYDKAGAYGIQEWIGYIAIERIEGSFYNVMGLPIQKLCVELDNFIQNYQL